MANIVNSIFSINETQTDELLASILARPTKDLANKLNALDLKISQVAQIVPDKGEKGDKGDKGDTGEKGQDGVKGRDGLNGLNGKNGKDGLDGLNGKDGVSIVDVDIALDNHLVITLSDGSEIDAGALYSGEGNDNFFISTSPQADSSGGGFQNLFVQETAPVTSELTYMWVQTNISGNPANFSFWFEDGL